MFQGWLVGIFIAADGGAPMEARLEACVDERGIHGDRYHSMKGKFKRPGSGQPVTLIERETIDAVNREGEVELKEEESRRNLITEGVPLNHLIGRTFRVGEVVLRGARLAEPCVHLERLVGRAVRVPLIHRGGLNCEVVQGGTIAVGDPIEFVLDDGIAD